MDNLKGKAAIVGLGTYKFSEDSGITELDMTCRAVKAALDDAGLTPNCVDGFVEYAEEDFDEILITRSMGIGNLAFHGDVRWEGGAACSMVQRAALAVAAGMVTTVVVVRSVNDASLNRQKKVFGERRTWIALEETYYNPYGLLTDAGRLGLNIRRYMHEYLVDAEAFGWVSVVARENGARNPNSLFFERPVTYEDYLQSPVTVDPLRSLDLAPPVDGAMALVVTSPERARRISDHPVYIQAAAQSMARGVQFKTSYTRPSITNQPALKNIGRRLFEGAGITTADIDVVQIEDELAPLVPMALEELGFCKRGEGPAFIEGGDRIRPEGELPLNTSGGSIGEGNLHGFNHIAEAVRQLRGTSTSPVDNAELALVVSGAFGPASGLILGR